MLAIDAAAPLQQSLITAQSGSLGRKPASREIMTEIIPIAHTAHLERMQHSRIAVQVTAAVKFVDSQQNSLIEASN